MGHLGTTLISYRSFVAPRERPSLTEGSGSTTHFPENSCMHCKLCHAAACWPVGGDSFSPIIEHCCLLACWRCSIRPGPERCSKCPERNPSLVARANQLWPPSEPSWSLEEEGANHLLTLTSVKPQLDDLAQNTVICGANSMIQRAQQGSTLKLSDSIMLKRSSLRPRGPSTSWTSRIALASRRRKRLWLHPACRHRDDLRVHVTVRSS